MGSKLSSSLRGAAKQSAGRERGTGQSEVSLRLRALQAELIREKGDPHDTIEALVRAIAVACSEGHLVSLTCVRGSATVLLRIRDGEDWLDWYCADPEFAENAADAIVAAFQPPA